MLINAHIIISIELELAEGRSGWRLYVLYVTCDKGMTSYYLSLLSYFILALPCY